MGMPKFRKSSFSINNTGCIELAATPANVSMRDSKNPDDGHVTFSPAQLAALVDATMAGELDHLA